jgi:hypothetical protein
MNVVRHAPGDVTNPTRDSISPEQYLTRSLGSHSCAAIHAARGTNERTASVTLRKKFPTWSCAEPTSAAHTSGAASKTPISAGQANTRASSPFIQFAAATPTLTYGGQCVSPLATLTSSRLASSHTRCSTCAHSSSRAPIGTSSKLAPVFRGHSGRSLAIIDHLAFWMCLFRQNDILLTRLWPLPHAPRR